MLLQRYMKRFRDQYHRNICCIGNQYVMLLPRFNCNVIVSFHLQRFYDIIVTLSEHYLKRCDDQYDRNIYHLGNQ